MTIRPKPARSPTWVRRARIRTSTARAVSPGRLAFGRRETGLRRDGPFLAGGRRRAGVRVRVATVATTVTAATQATHQPVLALDKPVYGLHPPREWREAAGCQTS